MSAKIYRKHLVSRHCCAEPTKYGGFYIYEGRQGTRCSGVSRATSHAEETLRGWCATKKQAQSWLDNLSGEAYARLPVARLEDVRYVAGARICLERSAAHPYVGWYRHDTYTYRGAIIGKVQVRSRRRVGTTRVVTDVLTLVGGSTEVKTMLAHVGFRVEV